MPIIYSSSESPPQTSSTLFPYTTLFRSLEADDSFVLRHREACPSPRVARPRCRRAPRGRATRGEGQRSEEHTSELQSHHDLVCRLLLEKKKKTINNHIHNII